jgi:thiosulfate reductase cytochrome b subunit
MTERVYIFKGFERFWHWTQGTLIVFLMLTGFEIHGTYTLFGFGKAVDLHTIAAWTLVGLWVFAIFWHFTTGEWRQYAPTLEKIGALWHYYTRGIFRGEHHPVHPTPVRKFNSLQRLSYLAILALVMPLIWITGWLQLFYGEWTAWGVGGVDLATVASGHTFGAFVILIFFIGHVYLATTGRTLTSHIRAIVTGWEEVE